MIMYYVTNANKWQCFNININSGGNSKIILGIYWIKSLNRLDSRKHENKWKFRIIICICIYTETPVYWNIFPCVSSYNEIFCVHRYQTHNKMQFIFIFTFYITVNFRSTYFCFNLAKTFHLKGFVTMPQFTYKIIFVNRRNKCLCNGYTYLY